MKKINIDKAILKYFFLIFASITTVSCWIIGVFYSLESKEYIKKIEFAEQAHLQLQLDLISNNFESISSDLLFLTKQNELLHLVNTNKTTYKEWIAKEYLELCKEKQIYDQIRFIDQEGMEVIRVNYNNGTPVIVPENNLQYKGERYYFHNSLSLNENELFISPLDLNMEKGLIDTPLKPMIRFGSPVVDNNGDKSGVVILNYLADNILKSLEKTNKTSFGHLMLLNSDSYWLYSSVKNNEWGFMIKERSTRKFSNNYPDLWEKILSSNTFQIHNDNGLFTVATIYPLSTELQTTSGSLFFPASKGNGLTTNQYFWKLISHISTEELQQGLSPLLVKLLIIAFWVTLLITVPSWIIARTIVQRKKHHKELYRSASYDKLTNLPNRSLFESTLQQTLKDSRNFNLSFAVMFIDLDGFKAVNDTLGHDAGDQLLSLAATRLLNCVRTSDLVARLGGDEFTVILSNLFKPEDSETIARKMIDELARPFILSAGEATISASIGISIYPNNGDNTSILLSKADDAMYYAKNIGKNCYKRS